MNLFKNYKKLYENEKNNNKILNEINSDLRKRSAEYQEEKNKLLAENVSLKQEIRCLKEKYAKVRIDLEDTKDFLVQEKQVSTALRKERATRKRTTTPRKKIEKEEEE